ncbi:hypothetical protein ACJQWK_08696 [Exserohilum turcicum]
MTRFLGLRGESLARAISVTCGLCFLCFGYAQGVMGGLLTVQQFLNRFPQVDIVNDSSFHNAWVTGLTVGTWHLGCIVSAVATIFIGDLLGRRRTLILGLTFWMIGEIIQTSSHSFSQFIVGRAVAGFGNGFTTSTAPAYQAECVKSHRKGTVLMISAGAFVSAGIALSYWLVFGFAFLSSSSASWRVPIALQIIFALPAIAMLFVLPESPRWLILTGREQEALTVLAALNDGNPDSCDTKDEFLQIKDAILIMAQGSSAGMFSNKERRGFHRVVLAYFVQVFQQATGINLVLQYLSWIFLSRMSYTGWLARLLASCSATLYFLASFIVVVGIDRFWGRRSLMMFGASGMSGCMVLITILQYLWSENRTNAGRIASTVFLFLFSVFFAIGWQGMAWLYQVEIVPLRIRGPANGLSTSANWLLNFVIVFITPIAFERISYQTWIIFAATNFAIIPLVYFFYPETAFRSLEEVDVIFQLAEDAPGNPWLNAVIVSKVEPLWFGKRDPEKRLKFNYGNSSWHKRLVASAGSGNSRSDRNGTGHTNEEKGHWSSDSRDAIIRDVPRGRTRLEESPIDRYPHSSVSPRTTFATTVTSDHERNSSRKRLQRNSHRASSAGSSENNSYFPVVLAFDPSDNTSFTIPPTLPTHYTSPAGDSPIEHSQWPSIFAPSPIVPLTRSTSQADSAISHALRISRLRRSSDVDRATTALNRILNPDLAPQHLDLEPTSPFQHARRAPSTSLPSLSFSSFSSFSLTHSPPRPRPASRDTIEYPGVLAGDERSRQGSSAARRSSGRETHLPDGVYQVIEGRITQVGSGRPRTRSAGMYEARDAGRAR